MNKFSINIAFLIIILIIIKTSSCVRDISVELPRPDERLVVEGYIELDSTAVVFLNKSYAYFDPVDPSMLENNIIWGNDAIVTVSDGTITETLTPALFDRYPYKGYKGSQIKGKIFGEYELNIFYDDNEYFATTTIPDSIGIDSVWFQMWNPADSLGPIGLNWQDPPGFGNFYKVTVRLEGVHNGFFSPLFTFNVLDDKLEDGKIMMFFPVFKPNDSHAYYRPEPSEDEDDENGAVRFFYKIGDTVSVKLSTMDKQSFRFWNSYFRNMMTDGNPFANPATVVTNIEGENVVGYWAGYGSHIQSFYIKDSVTVNLIDIF